MKNYVLGWLRLCGLCLLVGCGGGSISQPVLPLAITSGTPPSGTTGATYAGNGFVLTASGGKTRYSWSWAPAAGSALPPGLTLSNGMISGIPTNAGDYQVTVKVADSQSPPAQTTAPPYTITISDPAPLIITSGTPPGGMVGWVYAPPQNCGIPCVVTGGFPLTATGGVPPYSWNWVGANGSSKPPGLVLRRGTARNCDTTGFSGYKICGTPTTAGSYDVVVTLSDSASPQNQTSANYTIGIATPPSQATLASVSQLTAPHTRYQLIEIPTLGGPAAIGQVDGPGISQFINNSGVVVGGSDTTTPDPFCLNPDCFTPHGFRWQDGVLTDLGALEDTSFSHATSVNARGWITGGSFMSDLDPLTGQPVEHAVLWKQGKIVDLGTLGTGLESAGLYVNDAGEVVGFSTFDTTPDPSSFKGATIHAFISRNGVMQDLGTLGGPGAFPSGGCNNQRAGLVAGSSSTSAGESHAFLWDNGQMTDIPTLGGSVAGAQCANNKGQVLGQSTLPGDPGCPDNCFGHAFSWDHGTITDLGTLGGNFTLATWLNNNGEAVGGTSTSDDESFHAVLWAGGRITDLGTLDADCFSVANSINSKGQIVGQSFSCPDAAASRAVLWDRGSIIDLNAAIPPDSTLQLTEPLNINDRGEIVGRGLPAGCGNLDMCGRMFLLIPCDQAGTQPCGGNPSSVYQPTLTSGVKTVALAPDPQRTEQFIKRQRVRLMPRYHLPARY